MTKAAASTVTQLTPNSLRHPTQRHKLPGSQIAESSLIRNRAMAQQLCEHAQSLVGEVLVDEGLPASLLQWEVVHSH